MIGTPHVMGPFRRQEFHKIFVGISQELVQFHIENVEMGEISHIANGA